MQGPSATDHTVHEALNPDEPDRSGEAHVDADEMLPRLERLTPKQQALVARALDELAEEL